MEEQTYQPKSRSYVRGRDQIEYIKWEAERALPCVLKIPHEQVAVENPRATAAFQRTVRWFVPSQKNLLDIAQGAARQLWVDNHTAGKEYSCGLFRAYGCCTLSIMIEDDHYEASWHYKS